MKGNGPIVTRGAAVVAALVLILGVASTLRAQEAPVAERILSEADVIRFFTPASGALFALRSASVASAMSESLLRSDDGGGNWRTVDLPPGPLGEYTRRAVTVDPLDHTIVYASGAEGLYKSDDDAASWRVMLPTTGRVGQVAVSGVDTRLVYATVAPNGGATAPSRILRSRDGAASWEEILDARCLSVRLFPHPTDAARVVAALNCGPDLPATLYASQDQGATWSPWRPWPESDSTRGPGLSGSLLAGGGGARPERLYAAYTVHSLEEGLPLYRTDDAGGTWQQEIAGPREEIPPSSPKWQGGKFWSFIASLEYDPVDPDRVYVGLYGSRQPLRTSADGGATWTALALPSDLRNVAAVALGTDRQNLYVATAFGTYANGAEGVYRLRLSAS